ncbi:unnamed protein product, partial [Didymodactylos carnosus]
MSRIVPTKPVVIRLSKQLPQASISQQTAEIDVDKLQQNGLRSAAFVKVSRRRRQ